MTDDPFEVLTTSPPAIDAESATAILAEHFALDGALEALSSERDRNYLVTTGGGNRYVLKFANSAEHPDVTDLQTRALLHLEAAGNIAAPRLVRTSDGATAVEIAATDERRHIARVVSWLDGLPLQDAERAAGCAGMLGRCAADLGLALRDFEHAAADYTLLWDLKRASALRDLLDCVRDPSLREICRERIDRFDTAVAPRLGELRWQVIHNDLNPSNVLVDPDDASVLRGVIDFGDLVRAPLIDDVAVAAAYLLRDDETPLADVAEFVSAYTEIEPLADAEADLLYDLILTRSTMTVLITHWRAARYPENRDYILRSETRARRLLERMRSANTRASTETLRAAMQTS